jgi:hypothetical protein
VIVRHAGERIQLITQPDHAHLSRAAMEHCVALSAHPRRETILHAIGEHDNGWIEEDASPRVNPVTGEVLDFINAPADMRQGVWPRGITRLAHDPWAAALVAQHAIEVYSHFRDDSEWTAFFADLEERRAAMVRASGLPADDLLADYAFVRLGDLISLTFCVGWTDEHTLGEWRIRLSETNVLVSPDPFGGAAIPVEITALEILSEPFHSDDELRAALRHATIATLTGSVSHSR